MPQLSSRPQWLLIAASLLCLPLLLAAAVAGCNATSSARLAVAHPTSGGTYASARASAASRNSRRQA